MTAPSVPPAPPVGPPRGHPGGAPLPRWQRQLPLAGVLVVVALGLAVVSLVGEPGGYRVGLCLIAAALVGAAVARIVLPARRIGLLAVRSRPFDSVALLLIAASIAVLALSLPPGS